MRLTIAKIVMRIVGTLGGLLGVGMLCVTPFVLYHSIAERDGWMILLAIFPVALSVYFLYVSYLVWFRFSPLAVRHICGALGFCLLAVITKFFNPARDSHAAWPAFVSLGSLIVVYLAYRVASDRLSRLLFPKSVPGVQS